MKPIIVHKGRTNKLLVSVGYDVSNDVLTSEIRVDIDRESDLIAAWDIEFETDGIDGELILTLDDDVVNEITKTKGYMDIKRVSNGEPFTVWEEPLEVLFHDTVTA